MGQLVIVGLGPGDPALVTDQTRQAIVEADHVVLRTRRHPSASVAGANAATFDHLYEQADTFDDVYNEIVDDLCRTLDSTSGSVVYAVPGSPLVLERSVRYLRDRLDGDATTLPAVSFLDAVWARLRIDPVDDGVRMIDGHRFATQAAGQTGALLVAHTHSNQVLSDIKLSVDAGEEQRAIILQAIGTPEENVVEVDWPDIDRTVAADHLTSLFIPEMGVAAAASLANNVELMRELRQKCPWDAQQTHASLRRYLLEETYEVLEAVDAVAGGDTDGYIDLEEELGDLWFQILFHSQLATEAGYFTIDDVARTVQHKLVRRHPHVFGGSDATSASTVEQNWEQIKQLEKGRASIMEGIPAALPALAFAEKVLSKADRSGRPLTGDVVAELGQWAGASTEGERFAASFVQLVEQSRVAGVDAEAEVRAFVHRAAKRFAMNPDDRWIFG